MITCNLMGGLGNQLFQIFTTISYGIKSGNIFTFLNQSYLGEGNTIKRATYWKSLFDTIQTLSMDKMPQFKMIRETGFNYCDLNMNHLKNQNIVLYGYYQSYKYFHHEYKTIYKLLKLSEKKETLLHKMNTKSDDFTNTISIHFRYGDYKKNQECHPILDYKYYKKSLAYIKSKNPDVKYKIIYFCDEVSEPAVKSIIINLSQFFTDYEFGGCNTELHDWEQLLCMSLCDHNIIANSSFSWWGAFLNENINKIVCYPSIWFGPKMSHNTLDLFPPEWIKISTTYKYKVFSKFILFHQPKTAGTYVTKCLPDNYVLPHDKNYHFCLTNSYNFLDAKLVAIIRNPLDYYISLITFWCLDAEYCTDLNTSLPNLRQNYLANCKNNSNQHVNYWISLGYTERNLTTILNNIMNSDFLQLHKTKLIKHHHTYDYYVFDLLLKLDIGYYTFAFLDQFSRKKMTEFTTAEECLAEIEYIKNNFIILNQSNITHELKQLCMEFNVPFKDSSKMMVSNRKSSEFYNLNHDLINMIHYKDRFMFQTFDSL
jgi:hypothetical protein